MKMTHVQISSIHEGYNHELHWHAVFTIPEINLALMDEHRKKQDMSQ